MTHDDHKRAIREATRRGDISAGGPSEIAAYGLLDAAPAGYWENWSERAAERIRAGESSKHCVCRDGDTAGGRCQTCFGLVGASS